MYESVDVRDGLEEVLSLLCFDEGERRLFCAYHLRSEEVE